MPELPEVELVKRGLNATILGRRVRALEVRSPRTITVSRAALARAVVEQRIDRIAQRGKALIVDLGSERHLIVQPMMTGQFVVCDGERTVFAGGHPSRSMLAAMPNPTTRVIFGLSGQRTLFFNDARIFGRIRLVDSAALATDPFLTRLGPEPLQAAFTPTGLYSQLQRHRRAPIKAVILNQSVVAGVGNIYADETLHLARLHPARPAGALTGADACRLHRAICLILTQAIELGGTSFADHADPARAPTGYLAHARVFRRHGLPCLVCGTAIQRTRIAGRATNICPHCQRQPIAHRAAVTRSGVRRRRSPNTGAASSIEARGQDTGHPNQPRGARRPRRNRRADDRA